MANQVSELFIRLGIQGYEGIDKLKGAFRELDKVSNLTGAQIDRARQSIINFGTTGSRTEQVVRGQIEALRGLQAQVERGSEAWAQISNDIEQFRSASRRTDGEIETLRRGILSLANGTEQSQSSLRSYITDLERLRRDATLTGQVFTTLGQDIAGLTGRLQQAEAQTQATGTAYRRVIGQALAGTEAGLRRQLDSWNQEIAAQREVINNIDSLSQRERNLRVNIEQRTAAEEALNRALAQQVQVTTNLAGFQNRANVRAAAAAFNDPTYLNLIQQGRFEEQFGTLPNTTAGLNQELAELSTRLINTDRSSIEYINVAVRMAEVQRALSTEILGTAEAFRRLDIQEQGVTRRAAKIANIQEYYRTQGPTAPNVGGYRDPLTGAIIARGSGRQSFPAVASQEQVEAISAALDAVAKAQDAVIEAGITGRKRLLDVIEHDTQRQIELADKVAEAEIAASWKVVNEETAAFIARLDSMDKAAVRRGEFARKIGVGGYDLSPLYTDIVAMSAAAQTRQQQLMKKTPTAVFNDIVTAFNVGALPGSLETEAKGVGNSIAEGVSQGAEESAATKQGATTFASKLIALYKQAFRIKSPSGESRDKIGVPIGEGIGQGIIQGIKSFKTQIQAAVSSVFAQPQRAPLPGSLGTSSDVADRLQSFLARTTTRTSTYLPYARLLGEDVLSSPALQQAVYRRAYERGAITPSTFLPVEARRGLRGVAGLPGAGLEQLLVEGAFRRVSGTGSLVGPLAGPATSAGVLASLLPRGFAQTGYASRAVGGAGLPLFPAPSSRSLEDVYRQLVRNLAPQRFNFGPATQAIQTAITTEVQRALRGSPFVTASMGPRSTSYLGQATPLINPGLLSTGGLPSTPYGGQVRPLFSAPGYAPLQLSLPGTAYAMNRPDEYFNRVFANRVNAARMGSLYVNRAGQTTAYPSAFPLEGMMGPSSPIGGRPGVAQQSASAVSALNTTLEKFGSLNQRSIRDIQQLQSTLRTFVESGITPADRAYEELNAAVAKQERLLERELQRRQRGMSGRFSGRAFAQTAGAAISGGIFGGPLGLLGGIAGGLVGGTGGAFAGAAIGGQLGIFQQQLGQVAEYTAQLNLAKTTLAQVSANQDEYNRRLAFARDVSSAYTLGLRETINGYAQVSAAAIANGLTLKDTEAVYRGVVASAVAFGKSQADIDAIVTATTQVLSKGKLSAEELSGQLGERLPGAVARFAQATGRSLPELSQALKDGKVSIADFVTFAKKQGTDYDAIARLIGSSPEKAGARLSLALTRAGETYGTFLQRIGAKIQDFLTTTVNLFNQNEEFIKRFLFTLYTTGKAVMEFTNTMSKAAVEAVNSAFPLMRLQLEYAKLIYRQETGRDISTLFAAPNPQVDAYYKKNKEYQAFIKEYFPEFTPKIFGGTQPSAGGGTAEGDTKEQERARKKREEDAKVAAEQQQRYAESLVNQQVRYAETLFNIQRDLDEQRYQRLRELENLRYENEQRNLFGVQRDFAAAFNRYKSSLADIDRALVTSRLRVTEAQLKVQGATQIEAVVSRGSSQSLAGFTTQQLSAATATAARFTGIANMCAESVRAFYKSLGISLPGVTAWADTVREAGTVMTDWSKLQPGDIVAKGRPGDTTHVGVYTGGGDVFHQSRSRGLRAGNYPDLGYFQSGPAYFVRPSAGRMRSAEASRLNRAVRETGDVGIANLNLGAAQQSEAEQQRNAELQRLEVRKRFINDITESISQQNYELGNEIDLLRLRQRLQAQGYDSRALDLEEKRFSLSKKMNESKEIANRLAAENPTMAAQIQADLTKQNSAYAEQLRLIEALNAAQRDAERGYGFREGAQRYIESIGSMKEATAQLTVNGIQGLETALLDLSTTGTANFQSFAAELLKQTAKIILQQLVLKPLIQGLASLFNPAAAAVSSAASSAGSFAGAFGGPIWGGTIGAFSARGNAFNANGIVPFAMGGMVTNPTLFRYANGGVPGLGLMGEAGPEAILPLRRGRDGRLGVSAGGGQTNVTVNVDASGSSVSGDQGQSAALGRAVAQAVQQELIKQRRPGGLIAA